MTSSAERLLPPELAWDAPPRGAREGRRRVRTHQAPRLTVRGSAARDVAGAALLLGAWAALWASFLAGTW